MTSNPQPRQTTMASLNGSTPASSMNKPILSVESLTVSFDGFTVLDDLDFAMEYGEIRFLIGPNGAGKTTLIDVITGKSKPSRGHGFLKILGYVFDIYNKNFNHLFT